MVKKYVIYAVWNDTDFGKIGTVASFRTRFAAERRLNLLNAKLVGDQSWHYELEKLD